MKVIINFSNRWLYTLIIIGILILTGIGVYAWAGSNGVGHSHDEIEPCADGQVLQMSGSSWICDTVVSIDTNANTECSGTYTYLSGDGACRDVRSDGDIYDTDTNSWRPISSIRGRPVYKHPCSAGDPLLLSGSKIPCGSDGWIEPDHVGYLVP